MSQSNSDHAASGEAREAYDVHAVQEKWLPVWDALTPFRSGDPDDERPKKYVLDMFPYPSGDLHMGHAEAYALGDVVARYWVQRGFNVLHPIGWDAFGLPAENAAIKRGVDPAAWTYENIATQRASMRRYACSFDWDRVLNTCDPEFYRWNQWFFLKLFETGLAYRKPSQVNWCPQGPDRAGQRAGRRRAVRALRHPGHQEEADAVVLPDHRLRRPAAGRHAASWRGPGRTRC